MTMERFLESDQEQQDHQQDHQKDLDLCGCNLCAKVSVTVTKSIHGDSSVNIIIVDAPEGFQDGWYDAVLLGENGVFASPISTNPEEYEQLQRQEKYNIWMFESGHWDLRDVSLEVYEEHVTELLDEFVKFREKFKDTDAPFKLVWVGYPAYPFKRQKFGDMEKRTNVKLFKAAQLTNEKAQKRGIEVIPFFDLTYPLYRRSCDTHHFLCPQELHQSPIAYEILKLILMTDGSKDISNKLQWSQFL